MTLAPASLANWKGEDRDASGALGQDRIAWLDGSTEDQRVPGRDPRAGEGRRFLEAEVFGNAYQALLGQHDLLGQHAVHVAAKRRAGLGLIELSPDPSRHEAGSDALSGLEPVDPRAGHGHLAHAVGEGNERQPQPGIVNAPRDHQIPIVQRHRPDPDKHFSGAGRRRGEFLEAIRIRTGELVKAIGFHVLLLPFVPMPRLWQLARSTDLLLG